MTTAVVAPHPVVCVVDHLGRDLAVAEDARRGCFTHAGRTLELGRRPDWLSGAAGLDVEWRIEWVKLYEGLDLAHAFAATGDPEFLDTWQDLVESYVDQVPVGHDTSDVTARRLQNWLYAWQRFRAVPAYAGLRRESPLLRRIRADAEHVAAHLTPERNHRTLELYALLLVAIALGEDASSTLDLLADNAATDVWPDGVHRECSTDYHLIVLRSLLGAIANARQADLPVPPALLAAAERASDFALHVQRPDGSTPALSDGDPGDFRPLLSLGARLLGRADLEWAATGGRRGTPPATRLADFPVGGYFVQRSGWDDDARWAVFDCGPIGDGGHGHYDQLSVEMAAGGRLLLVDPGRYTYDAADGDWRHRFKGTAAHNTVCVDGLDQTPYRPGKPRATSTARLLGRRTRPGLDLLHGRVVSPAYDAVHTRTVAFVDDDYWIVHDRLRAPTPHRYAARWHLAPGDASVEPGRLRAPGLRMLFPGAEVTLEDGWVSPAYGIKNPAPVAVVEVAGTDVDLVTVVLPDRPDDATATVRMDGDAIAVTVRGRTVRWELPPC